MTPHELAVEATRTRTQQHLRPAHSRRVAPRGHAVIAGLGVALPPSHSQQELWDGFFSEHYQGRRTFERVWANCGVESRHGVADKFGLEVSTWTTERRMRQFIQDAVPLGARAIRAALAGADLSAADVDQLTVVSCTGYATPGLDTLLIEELGLDARVQRLHIGHMGCHAALPGLTVVSDGAVARGQVGVLLCLELTSLHIQPPTSDIRQLLVHALFSDAAAALVVVPPGADVDAPALEVIDFASTTEAASAQLMTWDVTDLGFVMGLSTKVPDVVRRHVGHLVSELLARHGLTTRDVAAWAVHPGGPEILDVVKDELGLAEGSLDPSRAVLRDHGNCSSPTILLVLDHLVARRPPAPGERIVVLAFGPGLTLCAALLQAGSA
jgi:predicted naringenin-chalcone synthase